MLWQSYLLTFLLCLSFSLSEGFSIACLVGGGEANNDSLSSEVESESLLELELIDGLDGGETLFLKKSERERWRVPIIGCRGERGVRSKSSLVLNFISVSSSLNKRCINAISFCRIASASCFVASLE